MQPTSRWYNLSTLFIDWDALTFRLFALTALMISKKAHDAFQKVRTQNKVQPYLIQDLPYLFIRCGVIPYREVPPA